MSLSITNLSKIYGAQQILDQVSLILKGGQRIGLVGANGVGKSTLLQIAAGQIEPDGGTVAVPSGIRIGYLPQKEADFSGQTIGDVIGGAIRELRQLEARLRELERQMSPGTTEDTVDAHVVAEYGEVVDAFERRGGYEIDHRVETVLAGLNIGHIPRWRPAATLSGGEKARLALAALLLGSPDALLLDEPTNHLDSASLNWLENFLASYRGAALIVSHDRQFLNRTVNAIVEIEEHSHQAKHYAGNYDAYLRIKAQERRRWRIEYERQQEEIKLLRHEVKVEARQVAHNRAPTDQDKFLKHFRRGNVEGSISRRVQAAEEKLRRIEADPIPEPPDDLRFDPDFDPQALKGRLPLIASGLKKSYGSQGILDDVSFEIDTPSRVVLVGPNGAGKSTLLKLLAGREQPDAGEITFNPQVRIGYLDQEQETLDHDRTLWEVYRDGLPETDQVLKSQLLSSGLFRYDDLSKPVRVLSKGQKRKLQIARLIAERANLLLLDEPTNDVSFDVLESLEEALRHFPGPIIAVSHDRRFLQKFQGQFGGEVWKLVDGRLIKQAILYDIAPAPGNWLAARDRR